MPSITELYELLNEPKPFTYQKPVEYKPRTQKAKGLCALRDAYLCTENFIVHPIEDVRPSQLVGYFVRPCPMQPRHGFVDSRLIESLDAAEKIIEETKAADPQAEIICMNKVDAKHSGIFTPGLLTIGRSNDGATTGRDALQLPTPGTYPGITDSLREQSGVTDAEYVEYLYTDDAYKSRSTVQLRNGPRLPQTEDFIPREIEVKKIVVAEGDLLEWETLMKDQPEGTVVSHVGGSLASHFSVHAVLNNVPVLTTRKPKLGEVLRQTVEDREIDLNKIRAGFYYAQYANWEPSLQGHVMLTGLHHLTTWKGKHDLLIGMGLGCAYRLCVLACLGEFRHEARFKNQLRRKSIPSRERVYECYNARSMQGITAQRLTLALKSFSDYSIWGTGSFGGWKWYQFGILAPQIHNALIKGETNRALELYNVIVNAAHNGGWAFNKFVSENYMTEAASNPTAPLLLSAPLLYEALKDIKPKNMVSRFMKRALQEEVEPTKVVQPLFKLNGKAIEAQGVTRGGHVHVQYKTKESGTDGYPPYYSFDTAIVRDIGPGHLPSWSGNPAASKYLPLTVGPNGGGIFISGIKVADAGPVPPKAISGIKPKASNEPCPKCSGPMCSCGCNYCFNCSDYVVPHGGIPEGLENLEWANQKNSAHKGNMTTDHPNSGITSTGKCLSYLCSDTSCICHELLEWKPKACFKELEKEHGSIIFDAHKGKKLLFKSGIKNQTTTLLCNGPECNCQKWQKKEDFPF